MTARLRGRMRWRASACFRRWPDGSLVVPVRVLARPAEPRHPPPVTVLKPLHGDEPLLEDALATSLPAGLPAVPARLRRAGRGRCRRWTSCAGCRRASRTATSRWWSTRPGTAPNRKVGNLINMLPAARHDVLVIADSRRACRARTIWTGWSAALEQPGTGLVTTLYAGLPARRGAAAAGSARRRSPTASCPARCWPARWAGRTAWARRCACGGHARRGSAASRRWSTIWPTTTCSAGWCRRRAWPSRLADTVPLTTVPEASSGRAVPP